MRRLPRRAGRCPARRLERVEEVAIDRDGAERRLDTALSVTANGSAMPAWQVPEDDEEVGVGALEQLAVGPRVRRPAAVEVDVRRAGARGAVGRGSARARGRPGPVRRGRRSRRSAPRRAAGLAGIGAARVRGRPHRALPGTRPRWPAGAAAKRGLSRNPSSSRLSAIVAICSTRGRLAVARAARLARISLERMLAVEERDQVERGASGSSDDLVGEAARDRAGRCSRSPSCSTGKASRARSRGRSCRPCGGALRFEVVQSDAA